MKIKFSGENMILVGLRIRVGLYSLGNSNGRDKLQILIKNLFNKKSGNETETAGIYAGLVFTLREV
jgi:hypothetical protein